MFCFFILLILRWFGAFYYFFQLVKQCFSKWAESPPWGRVLMVTVRKIQRGRQGAKQHKGGENAQPLIDHWVNFSSLILWPVSFLQFVYYDIIVGDCCNSNLSVKFLLWIVCVPGYSVDYLGLRSRRRKDTAPSPELSVFMSVALAPVLSFLWLRLLVVFTH